MTINKALCRGIEWFYEHGAIVQKIKETENYIEYKRLTRSHAIALLCVIKKPGELMPFVCVTWEQATETEEARKTFNDEVLKLLAGEVAH